MGKHSLPKIHADDFAPVPKNRFSSMLVDKRCKRRRDGGRNGKCARGRSTSSSSASSSSSSSASRRRPQHQQQQRHTTRRQQRRPVLHPSRVERVHAKTARRKDVAADVLSVSDPFTLDRGFQLRFTWNGGLRERLDGPRGGGAWFSALHGYSDNISLGSNRRFSYGYTSGRSFDGDVWEPHHHLVNPFRAHREHAHAHVDMDEVLECGLTRRQVEELQFRDITPDDFELLLELDEKVAKKTLGEERANKLFSRAVLAEGDEPVDCGVCLCEVEVDDVVVRLPCEHAFHDACITKWLTEYNTSCPFKCNLTNFEADGEAVPVEAADAAETADGEAGDGDGSGATQPAADHWVILPDQAEAAAATAVAEAETAAAVVAEAAPASFAAEAAFAAEAPAGAEAANEWKAATATPASEGGTDSSGRADDDDWEPSPARWPQMRTWSLRAVGGGKFEFALTV